MAKKHSLFDDLKLYNEKGIYPLHMPGHKRQMSLPGLPAMYDYTEVEGTDDLHHPDGILKESMERTAQVFGSDRTWYLVNGSTCGNLAGVSAICPLKGELIVARNCHRSVFHALELRNIIPHWVYPMYDEDYGILGSVAPEDIEKLLEKYPASRGVVITSPTYEGVVSDIASIAEVCHKHRVPLFVDEAHGAHFGLVESADFPDSAIHKGADLVVQSAHKTLIGLTQSAFLHLKSDYIKEQDIDRFIDIYETSSPSYPLMMSLDACTELVLNHGEEIFRRWSRMLSDFDDRIMGLKHLRVFSHGINRKAAWYGDSINERLLCSTTCETSNKTDINPDICFDELDHEIKATINTQSICKRNNTFFEFDNSKILINCRYTPLTGESLMALLRDRYHFELEMSLSDNALAMTGPGDDPDEIMRLAEVLLEIDKDIDHGQFYLVKEEVDSEIVHVHSAATCSNQGNSRPLDSGTEHVHSEESDGLKKNQSPCARKSSEMLYEKLLSDESRQIMTLQEAVEAEGSCIKLDAAEGHISGEYIYCYPPGIPLVVPGEKLEKDLISTIKALVQTGCRLHFTKSKENDENVFVTV